VQGSHAWRGAGAVFDEDNLVSHAGLVPVLELAEQAGLSRLLAEHVRFTSERVKSGTANPTPKLTSIVAGMACTVPKPRVEQLWSRFRPLGGIR
jgi:hypothetical protein